MPALPRFTLCATLIGAMMVFAAFPADAQDPPSRRELMRMAAEVQSKIKAPLSTSDSQAVQKYFQEYYFPSMAKSDTQSLEELGEKRADLFGRYIWEADPSAQRLLTAEAYSFARSVLAGRQYPQGAARASYSPPVKVNAALILGMLDEKYATRSDPSVKPLPAATRLLAQIVVYCADRQMFPSYVESAALTGLERHARFAAGLDAQSTRYVQGALLKAIGQEEYRSPTPRSARNWMKLQAAEGLANFKTAGPNGVFTKAIAGLLQEERVDLHTRCAALEQVKRMDLNGTPAAVGQQLLAAAKQLACDVAAEERKNLIEVRKLASTANRSMVVADTNVRYKYDEQLGWQYERRGLSTQLTMLNEGLGAVKAVAGDDAAAIDSVTGALKRTLTAAEEEDNPYEMMSRVEGMCDEVKRAFGCQANPAAADQADAEMAVGGLMPGRAAN